MRAVPFALAVTALLVPQIAAAADIAISCALTDESIALTVPGATAAQTAERRISETEHLTIGDAVLLTPVGAPCNRMDATMSGPIVDASCAFPMVGNSQATLAITIDRDSGVISEVWDIVELDGSLSHNSKAGLCSKETPSPLTKAPNSFVAQDKAVTLVGLGSN